MFVLPRVIFQADMLYQANVFNGHLSTKWNMVKVKEHGEDDVGVTERHFFLSRDTVFRLRHVFFCFTGGGVWVCVCVCERERERERECV